MIPHGLRRGGAGLVAQASTSTAALALLVLLKGTGHQPEGEGHHDCW